MKYLTFSLPSAPRHTRLGALLGEKIIDLGVARTWAAEKRSLPLEEFPDSAFELILAGLPAWQYARNLVNALEGEDPLQLRTSTGQPVAYPLERAVLSPPLARPMSVRDFYAFEEHVVTSFASRGQSVPPEWYQFPAFYYSNPNSIYGPNEIVPRPSYTQALDYELEVACIIGRPGINILPEQAEDYIFGYTILNDWSARDVQRLERKVGLGPAKSKDFASSLGPWIVTPDELEDCQTGRPGVYDLEMKARVNNESRSRGNWKDMYYSFGEMIARASQDTWLMPGDVIGSGTVGTGCLLELTRGLGPWLQPGDRVEMEIERIGILRNEVS